MRLILLAVLMAITIAVAVSGADVGLYVEFPDGSTYQECVTTSEGISGYEVLRQSSLSTVWSGSGLYGRALCKINGIGDEVSGSTCVWSDTPWSYFVMSGSSWQLSPVGLDTPGDCWNRDYSSFGGKYCAKQGDILGFIRTSFDTVSFNAVSRPADVTFEDICNKLLISDIEVKVDGKRDKGLEDGDTIGRDAEPGSDVSIDITFENLDQNLDINDVEVTVTIKDIDDGDDLEEDLDEFDIRAGRDKSADVDFSIPMIVDEDDFEVLIEAEGRDEDGTRYRVSSSLTLQVDKKKHDVVFLRTDIEPSTVRCTTPATLTVEIANIGTEDEDDVSYSISAPGLEFFVSEENLDLEADDVDDSVTRTAYLVDTSSITEDTTVHFDFTLKYDGKSADSSSEVLSISGCSDKDVVDNSDVMDQDDESMEKGDEETVIVESDNDVMTPLSSHVVYAKAAPTSIYEEWKIAGLIVLDILLVLAVASLIALVVRRR